jgi:hypothetical protein
MLKSFFATRAVASRATEAMHKLVPVILLLIFSIILNISLEAVPAHSAFNQKDYQDKKVLLNGRIWWNQYSKAVGDQFFLDGSFLKGSVVFNGTVYRDLDLKYDIANDELIFSLENHPAICLNKEMVDSFTLQFQNRNYNIINAGYDTASILKGYVNLLYKGHSALYVKYTKLIYPLAVDGRYDLFVSEHHVFLNTEQGIVVIKGKRQLLKILKDKKKELSHFIRDSNLKCNLKNPESIIPVVVFYDKLKEQKTP